MCDDSVPFRSRVSGTRWMMGSGPCVTGLVASVILTEKRWCGGYESESDKVEFVGLGEGEGSVRVELLV